MGGKKSSPEIAKVDPTEQAMANAQAQIASIPGIAEAQWGVRTNPTYGDLAQSQLTRSIQEQMMPGAGGVQNQLIQSIQAGLQNPLGYTSEQQAAIDALRGRATEDVQRQLRTRQNLGGKLYGGIGYQQEADALSNLQNQFVESDINRQMQNYAMNTQLASQIMALLQGQPVTTSPIGYQSPVVSANQQYSTAASENQANLQAQLQQQANQNALYSALFGGLGGIAGSALGGPLGGALGAKLGGGTYNYTGRA